MKIRFLLHLLLANTNSDHKNRKGLKSITTTKSTSKTMVNRELFGRKDVNVEIPDDVFPSQEEIDTIDNITGKDCQHGWYKSCSSRNNDEEEEEDGNGNESNTRNDNDIQLHYRHWPPPDKDNIKGIVIYTHGIHSQSGHASRLQNRPLDVALLVDTFTNKGMAVYAGDQYGHGFSEGTRFYIPSWEENRNDLITFVNLISDKNSKDIPIFMAGESYGGCLTILATKYFQDFPSKAPINFDSCLLIAPAIEGDLPPFPVLQLLRYVLAPIAPKWTPFFMPNTVSPDKIWRDTAVCDYYTTPRKLEMKLDAIGKPFRLGTAVQLLKALEECRSIVMNYKQSFCIVHGSNDIAVPISGSKLLFDNCVTSNDNKELHIINESYHGILAEPEAEEAMEHIISYVDKRMKKFTTTTTSK